jgi:hypothetical protein
LNSESWGDIQNINISVKKPRWLLEPAPNTETNDSHKKNEKSPNTTLD